MQLADLERESGVSVATIKYYLREGLLPRGAKVSATRAEYSDEHVARLRLIKAMVVGAGVSIAQVRRIVAVLDDPPERAELLGVTQVATVPQVEVPDTEDAATLTAEVVDLASQWGCGDECAAVQRYLVHSLATMRAAGLAMPTQRLQQYAAAMREVARVDLDIMRSQSTSEDDEVKWVVAGTLASDPVLLALRRLAQAAVATEMLIDYQPSRSSPPAPVGWAGESLT